MNNLFNIYIDRLKDGHNLLINETVDASFLDLQDEELSFQDNVKIKIEAYITEDHLILHFSLHTIAYIPCSICNQKVEIPIDINNDYHTEPLENITSHIFDTLPLLRESILLNVPPFAECNNGDCPERASMGPYLAKGASAKDITYHPFADL